MSSGYVLDFTDRTFGEFFDDVVQIDIHSERYQFKGTSKANKFRSFWEVEPDAIVGVVLGELISEYGDSGGLHDQKLVAECRAIAGRLRASAPDLRSISEVAERFDSQYLQRQIDRMESAIDSDPALAIGTAKELIETCCKTILEERGQSLPSSPEMSELTKETFKELKLTRDDVPQATRGAESVKRILSNLGSISNELNRLRGSTGRAMDRRRLPPPCRHVTRDWPLGHPRRSLGSCSKAIPTSRRQERRRLRSETSTTGARQS